MRNRPDNWSTKRLTKTTWTGLVSVNMMTLTVNLLQGVFDWASCTCTSLHDFHWQYTNWKHLRQWLLWCKWLIHTSPDLLKTYNLRCKKLIHSKYIYFLNIWKRLKSNLFLLSCTCEVISCNIALLSAWTQNFHLAKEGRLATTAKNYVGTLNP